MSKIPERKRLFFDIETSPNIGLYWKPGFNITVLPEGIIKEKSIICIGYKWEHERKVNCLSWDKNQNDKAMLEEFVPLMNEADELIGHNSERFDIPWIRGRAFKHSIPVFPSYTSVDTYKAARGRFELNSNKLDYIAKYLKIGHKIKTDFDLWKRVLLDNDQKALKEMIKYCKNDVILLEKVWKRMSPYLLARTSTARYTHACPECGSENTRVQKKRVTAAGYKKVQFQCGDCGKYHTMAESRFEKRKPL